MVWHALGQGTDIRTLPNVCALEVDEDRTPRTKQLAEQCPFVSDRAVRWAYQKITYGTERRR